MVPGQPPLAVSSKTTIFTHPERLPSPAYSIRSRLRVIEAERRRRPLQSLRSTSTALDRLEPRKARPEVALVTCSGGVGSPPDNTLTEQAPPDIAGWRGDLHGRRGLHPGAPSGARPVESHRNQGQIGFRRTGASQLDASRRIATYRRPRSATPTRMVRAPFVVGSWTRRLERPSCPGAFAPRPNPPARHPACAGRPASRAAARFPPRRGPRLAAPKVLSIRGAPRGAESGPASRDRS